MQTIHLHNDVNSYIYICQHSSIMQTIHLPIVELTNKGMNLEDWSQNSCNFFAVSDSSTCPDIKTSWCHSDIIEHFKIWVFENDPIGLQWGSKNQKCLNFVLKVCQIIHLGSRIPKKYNYFWNVTHGSAMNWPKRSNVRIQIVQG